MTEEKKRAIAIQEQRVGTAEFRRRDWIVDAAEGTTLQDIVEPGYWAFVCKQFSPFDRIDVRLETGEWMAELVVLQVGISHAVVHMIHHYSFVEVMDQAPTAQSHIVYWRGNHHKFAVKRLSDQQVIKQEFATREEADIWLKNHERTVAQT